MGAAVKTGVRWGPDGQPGYYAPSSAGRRLCRLSSEATEFIIKQHCGPKSKPAKYILIEPEGDLRLGGPLKMVHDWKQAIKIALSEGVYIYNARSKCCSRPIWACDPEERTPQNMTFEEVRLVADPKIYDKLLPRIDAKLFTWENE